MSDVCTNLYKCFAVLEEIKTLEAQECGQKGPTFLSCPERPCVISVALWAVAVIVVLMGCEMQRGFEPVSVMEPRTRVDVPLLPGDPRQRRGPAAWLCVHAEEDKVFLSERLVQINPALGGEGGKY